MSLDNITIEEDDNRLEIRNFAWWPENTTRLEFEVYNAGDSGTPDSRSDVILSSPRDVRKIISYLEQVVVLMEED